MNGLLRRLTRRRAAPADEPPPGTPAASEPADATVISLEEAAPLSEEEQALQAREEELRRQRRDLPAGVDPAQLETPTSEGARHGALHRRVRYLHSVREILLRDLGGFYYEVHRAGTSHGGHRDILETKAGRLAAVDHELRELEARLGVAYAGETLVREPGIGGTCPACGELHASDAGWCSHCGTPLSDHARRRTEEEVDREIAAREQREADRARAEAERTQATAPPENTDPSTAELARRVHEVTAHDEPTGETAVVRADTAQHDDAPTSELTAHDEDAVTQGERRR